MSTTSYGNMSSMNHSRSNEEWIDIKRHEIFIRLLPVIITMTILLLLGIVGNVLSLIFYLKQTNRSSSRSLIIMLSSVDLIVCALIPLNLVEMVLNIGHHFEPVCKLSHFLGHWVIALSSLTLWIIAIERYRKICVPFGKQMTTQSAFYAFTGCGIFSLLISIRDGVHFVLDPVDINILEENRTITGTMCSTTSDPNYKISISLFYAIDTMLVFVCWTTIIVTYSRIALTLYRMKKTKKRNQSTDSTRQRVIQRDCNTTTLERTAGKSDIHTDGEVKTVFYDDSSHVSTTNEKRGDTLHSNTNTLEKGTRKKKKSNNPATSASERNITFMMLTVSIGFVLCLMPYFGVRISRLVLKLGADHELELGNQFSLRLAYVNSVFNPIVYYFFNPRFRQYFKDKLVACFTRNN